MSREIADFKIYHAYARFLPSGRLYVKLNYPSHPERIDKRLPAQPEHGIGVYERLIAGNYTRLASFDAPIKPASGRLVFHRRGSTAPTHKLYHGVNAGFGDHPDHAYSATGIRNTAYREFAEEVLLITDDEKPRLLVPEGLEARTEHTVRRLGLEFSDPITVKLEKLRGGDTLDVYNDTEGHRFRLDGGCLSLLWEGATSLTYVELQRLVGFPGERVIPIDVEGHTSPDGRFRQFVQESYAVPLTKLNNVGFGDPIPDAEKYCRVARCEGGKITLSTECLYPGLGPDLVQVVANHVFAPDELLGSVLANLGISGPFHGAGRLQVELEKTKAALERRTPLPAHILTSQPSRH